MNDKEKLEAIKKLLSINTESFKEYAGYVYCRCKNVHTFQEITINF